MTKSAKQDTTQAPTQPRRASPRRSPPRPEGRAAAGETAAAARRRAAARDRGHRQAGPRRDEAQVPRGARAQAPGPRRGPGQGRPRRRRRSAARTARPRAAATSAARAAKGSSLLRLLQQQGGRATTTAPPSSSGERGPLAEERRAKRDGHHRVDVGVGRTPRRSAAAAARSRSRSGRAATLGRSGRAARAATRALTCAGTDVRQLAGAPRRSPVSDDPAGQHLHRAANQRAERTRAAMLDAANRCPSWHARARGRQAREAPRRCPSGRATTAIPARPMTSAIQPRSADPLPVDEPVGKRHPQRDAGDQQRGQPRRQGLFRVGHPAVAEGEQQRAHHRHRRPTARAATRARDPAGPGPAGWAAVCRRSDCRATRPGRAPLLPPGTSSRPSRTAGWTGPPPG